MTRRLGRRARARNERNERNELLARVRSRALTLPPTDELRLVIESGDRPVAPEAAATHEAPVRKPGSVGRRAADLQDGATDRRQAPDRCLPP